MGFLINGAGIDYPYEKYKVGSLTFIIQRGQFQKENYLNEKGKAEILVEGCIGEQVYTSGLREKNPNTNHK